MDLKLIFLFILYFSPEVIDKIESYTKKESTIKYTYNTTRIPDSIKMFNYINKYSKKYNVPVDYVLGIAHKETGYKGPFQSSYNPYRTSYAGALGPMQIMPGTANLVWKRKISIKELKYNLELNIETSIKLLRILYDKYGDWGLVFGCYNTGKPCINKYSKYISNFAKKKTEYDKE